MNRLTLVFGVAALALSSACTQRFLVHDYFIPDTAKVARETLEQSGLGDANGNATLTYRIQVCDLNDGKATNCKTTTILDNILAVNFVSGGF